MTHLAQFKDGGAQARGSSAKGACCATHELNSQVAGPKPATSARRTGPEYRVTDGCVRLIGDEIPSGSETGLYPGTVSAGRRLPQWSRAESLARTDFDHRHLLAAPIEKTARAACTRSRKNRTGQVLVGLSS